MDRLDTVLLTSTNKEIRQTMREILEEKYNTLEAGSFRQTLLLVKHNEACVVAVVMDLTEDAWEHLQEKPLTEWFPNIPVIVVCERDDASFLEDAFRWGAADVIPVSYHGYAMLRRIDNLVDLNAHKTYFQNKVSQQAKQLHRTYEKLLETLTSIVEFREMETGVHISRVRYITNVLVSKVAQYCPEYNLTPEDVENISNSSALHDIGKIGIPDSILTKPGALTPEEWVQIRKHPEIGCEILSNIVDSDATMYMRYAAATITSVGTAEAIPRDWRGTPSPSAPRLWVWRIALTPC